MNEIVASNGAALMSFIERAAKDDSFDVAKFGELLRLKRDTEHDMARRAFNAAMAACQSEMLPVIRTASNRHLGNKYAKLEDIDRQMRPIYTRHGFSVRFGSAPPPEPGWMRITCTVAHEAGYFEENYLDSPVTTTGSQGGKLAVTPVQAVGSTVTYLRRYLETMVFNLVLADDDDDGEATREPLRAAAAATPRAARAYEAPDALAETDPRRWLVNLETALANAQTKNEVVQIGGHASVGKAVAQAPDAIKRRVSELLANAFGRFAEPDLSDEALGEVQIAGEEKLAAG